MIKALTDVRVKDAEAGTVTALFSTFDVIDSDRDVVRPGSFKDGTDVVISAYGHGSWDGRLPVGTGTIKETGDGAVLDGEFLLDTEHGRDTFRTVKALADKGLGEWSYSLENVKSSEGEWNGEKARIITSIDVREVSPVLRGASVDTRTLNAKSFEPPADMKFVDHLAAVVAAVETVTTRAADVMAMRAKKGKALAGDSIESLANLETQLEALKALLETPNTPTPDDLETLQREYLRFVQGTTTATGAAQ